MNLRERILSAMRHAHISGPSQLAKAASIYFGKEIKPQSISYLLDTNNNAQKSKYTKAIAQACNVSYLWLSEEIGQIDDVTIYADAVSSTPLFSPKQAAVSGHASMTVGDATLSATGTVYKKAPVVGIAQLGDDGYWLEADYPVGHGDGWVEIPSNDTNVYSLEVRGDSMSPALRDGWIVVVEPNHDPVQGEFVLAKTTDGKSMVKEFLYQRAGRITLSSINEDHARLSLNIEDIEKLHYIAAIMPPSKRKHL